MRPMLISLGLLVACGCGDAEPRPRSRDRVDVAEPAKSSRELEAELDQIEREISGDRPISTRTPPPRPDSSRRK